MGQLWALYVFGFGLFSLCSVSWNAGSPRTFALLLYAEGSEEAGQAGISDGGEGLEAQKESPLPGEEGSKDGGKEESRTRERKALRSSEKPKLTKKYDFEKYEDDKKLFHEMKEQAKKYSQDADVVESQAKPPSKPGFFHTLWEKFFKFLESKKRPELLNEDE